MSELDMAIRNFKEARERDERATAALSRKYRGTFKDRSGLSDKDFQNRKSSGRYSLK